VDPELAAAIDGLYSAFRDYDRPATFEACPCCWGAEDGIVPSPGGDRPLQALTAQELEDVASQMPGLGGDIATYKHYLPRLYEIAVTDGFDLPEFPELVARINDGRDPDFCWSRWPESEQGAIRRFFHAVWRDRLASPPDIDGLLLGFIEADPDVDWYLAEWLRFESPTAAGHLEDFLAGTLSSWVMKPSRRRNADPRLVAWITSSATKAAVEAAADHARTPAERDALAEAYLRWLS
jgi:hypothetical protein